MTDSSASLPVHRWLSRPLSKDVVRSIERLTRLPDVQHIAILPDVHLADDVCVGVALATQRLIYPAAVGGDIGCGMAAIRVNATADQLDDESAAGRLLLELAQQVPALRHAGATSPGTSGAVAYSRERVFRQLPAELSKLRLSCPRLEKNAQRDGRVQLGTLGRGNHFLEFQADSQERLWIMLHSGSRAMGQAIAAHHLRVAQHQSGRRHLAWLDSDTAEGRAYLSDVTWAIRYAEENRLAMLRVVEQILSEQLRVGLDWSTLIHVDHNHVRAENHDGRSFFVHRKGALPAGHGVPGIIPGSMGSASFHVTGRGCAASLCSSSHGAGRTMSRGEAGRSITPGELMREMRGVWFNRHRAKQLCDEAPSAYKCIYEVMRAQRELTRIDRELRPVVSFKGC